jgi:hypothetical protein
MSSLNTVRPESLYRRWHLIVFQVSPANTLVGSADERALDIPSRSLWSSRLQASRRQEVRSIDDRMDEVPILESMRRLLQMDTKIASRVTERPLYTEQLSPWRHGRYKCAEIVCTVFPLFVCPLLGTERHPKQRRPESIEDVLRVKIYEPFTRVTIFLPDDFHGVVQRLGHSGRSISCSRAALYLKESNNLRFTGVADATEDQVLVRTEKILHICVAGHDAPVARTGRFRRNSH